MLHFLLVSMRFEFELVGLVSWVNELRVTKELKVAFGSKFLMFG